MTKEITIAAKQSALITQAQAQVNAAQSQLNLVLATVLAGHDVEGRVVSLTDNTLTVEVPDISPDVAA